MRLDYLFGRTVKTVQEGDGDAEWCITLDGGATIVNYDPGYAAPDGPALEGLTFTSYDQSTGAFTNDGKDELRSAEQAWDKYLTLSKKPDDTIASLMVQAFSPQGLNKPDKAVGAMEIIIANRDETAPLYVQLAALAYQAGQTRKAELASEKAIKLAPKDDKEQIRAQLQAARASVSLNASPGGNGQTTVETPTTPSG